MALCASGEMSLGGSTTGRSVNLELGRTATTAICMNESAVRTLAGVASGAISMNCFYGKSNAPTTLGQVFGGGYYTGVIDIGGGVTYYMILSPNATGCAAWCQWKTTATSTAGTCSTTNGYLNTRPAMENTTHPAGNFTATRSINGYSDWYLPSVNETGIMYTNKGSMPGGEGFVADFYWSSTECSDTDACIRVFSNCNAYGNYKTNTIRVRALRRSKT